MSKLTDKDARKNIDNINTLIGWVTAFAILGSIGWFIYGIVVSATLNTAIGFLLYSLFIPFLEIIGAVIVNIGLKWMACVLNTLVDMKNSNTKDK